MHQELNGTLGFPMDETARYSRIAEQKHHGIQKDRGSHFASASRVVQHPGHGRGSQGVGEEASSSVVVLVQEPGESGHCVFDGRDLGRIKAEIPLQGEVPIEGRCSSV